MLKQLAAITLTAQAWALHTGTPATLSDPRIECVAPEAVINAEGHAAVAWISLQNSDEIVYASHKSAGEGGWSVPRKLSSEGTEIWNLSAHIDGSGNVSVLWEVETNDSDEYLQWAKKPFEQDWTKTADLTGPDDYFWGYSSKFEPSGQVLGIRTIGQELRTQNFWGTQYIVQTAYLPLRQAADAASLHSSIDFVNYSNIAVGPEGKALAVWASHESWPSRSAISVSWRIDGNTWTSPEKFFIGSDYVSSLRAAVSSAKHAAVVWEIDDTVQAIVHSEKGWSEAAVLSSLYDEAEFPQIAVDSEGNAMAVWESMRGNQEVVCAAYKPVGQPWTDSIDMSPSEAEIMTPILSCDNAGHFVIIWSQFSGGSPTVWGRQFSTADKTFSSPALLSPVGQPCAASSIAFAEDKGIISWVTSSNGSDRLVQAADLMVD